MDFSLTSWNIHGLPYPLDLHFWPFSRIPRHGERAEAIAARVLTSHPDVCVFQEVWTDQDVERFTQRFKSAGYTVSPPPRTRFPRSGGLLTCVASGWQVLDARFEEYITNPGPANSDARSHKGVQVVKVQKGAERLVVLNTHLQSQYPPKHFYADIRKAQIERLTEVATKEYESDRDAALLAVGDFNTYPYPSDADAYLAMSTGKWRDLTSEARAECGCETNYDSVHPTEMEGWIDYVLAYQSGVDVRAEISLMRNTSIDNPYSDHHGLHANVSITRAAREGVAATIAAWLCTQPTTRREWLTGLATIAANRAALRL